MAITTKLELRQSQQLVMTPQLQQAIKLLQLSNLELNEFVDAELERNPLLERDEEYDSPTNAADSAYEKDGGSDGEDGDFGRLERQDRDFPKETAVDVRYFLIVEKAAALHAGQEGGHFGDEAVRMFGGEGEQLTDETAGKNGGVFGEEAEENLDEEMRNRVWVLAAGLERGGDGTEAGSGILGDVGRGRQRLGRREPALPSRLQRLHRLWGDRRCRLPPRRRQPPRTVRAANRGTTTQRPAATAADGIASRVVPAVYQCRAAGEPVIAGARPTTPPAPTRSRTVPAGSPGRRASRAPSTTAKT